MAMLANSASAEMARLRNHPRYLIRGFRPDRACTRWPSWAVVARGPAAALSLLHCGKKTAQMSAWGTSQTGCPVVAA
jgi:hypothetical protein